MTRLPPLQGTLGKADKGCVRFRRGANKGQSWAVWLFRSISSSPCNFDKALFQGNSIVIVLVDARQQHHHPETEIGMKTRGVLAGCAIATPLERCVYQGMNLFIFPLTTGPGARSEAVGQYEAIGGIKIARPAFRRNQSGWVRCGVVSTTETWPTCLHRWTTNLAG